MLTFTNGSGFTNYENKTFPLKYFTGRWWREDGMKLLSAARREKLQCPVPAVS